MMRSLNFAHTIVFRARARVRAARNQKLGVDVDCMFS